MKIDIDLILMALEGVTLVIFTLAVVSVAIFG